MFHWKWHPQQERSGYSRTGYVAALVICFALSVTLCYSASERHLLEVLSKEAFTTCPP